jgi:hypothetical protein
MKPIRMCAFCRKRNEKDKYFRIVSDVNGNAIYDKEQKINSRAIYFCKSKECIGKTINMLNKNKMLLKLSINKDSLIDILKNVENELGE